MRKCLAALAARANCGLGCWPSSPAHGAQVGFGEAGAEVIANNIKSGEQAACLVGMPKGIGSVATGDPCRAGGDLDPMVPGQRVAAIFGFCDIRAFTGGTCKGGARAAAAEHGCMALGMPLVVFLSTKCWARHRSQTPPRCSKRRSWSL